MHYYVSAVRQVSNSAKIIDIPIEMDEKLRDPSPELSNVIWEYRVNLVVAQVSECRLYDVFEMVAGQLMMNCPITLY